MHLRLAGSPRTVRATAPSGAARPSRTAPRLSMLVTGTLLFAVAATAGATEPDAFDLVVADPPPGAEEVIVPLPLRDGPAALVVAPRSLRAPGFRLLVGSQARALVEASPPPSRTYRGILMRPGRPDATAAATLEEGLLRLVVVEPDGSGFSVQPARDLDPRAPRARHVVLPNDGGGDANGTCSVTAAPAPVPALLAAAGGAKLLELGVDADVELYLAKGSVAATLTDVETLLNAAEVVFAAQAGVSFVLHTAVVRTLEPDPFSSGDPQTLLGELQTEWNGPLATAPRDTVHLFTGRDLNGAPIGFANVGVACLTPFAYSLSQTTYSPQLLLRTALLAHEVAHNLNATHCAGSDCRIMCPSIGGCSGDTSQFGAAAVAALQSFAAAAPCLSTAAAPHPLPFVESVPLPSLEPARWSDAQSSTVVTASGASAPFAVRLSPTGATPSTQATLRSVPLSLGSLSAAEVSATVRRDGAGGSDAVVFELETSGGAFVEAFRVSAAAAAAFVAVSAPVPSAALHDGARLRIRTEGNAAGDAFLVDDVRVGPPNAAPVIASLFPPSVASIAGGKVAVTGSGFLGAGLAIQVANVALPSEQVTVLDDRHVEFTAPVAPALGAVPVVVSTGGGTSAPSPLTYVPPSPPVLLVPQLVLNGWSLNLEFGGPPGGPVWLLVNASGATVPSALGAVLSPAIFLPLAPLDGVGLGQLSAPILGIPAGTTFWLQLATLAAPGTDAGTLEVSSLAATFVLF